MKIQYYTTNDITDCYAVKTILTIKYIKTIHAHIAIRLLAAPVRAKSFD